MNRILIEACCGSAEDVARAAKGGADRAELNSCLALGGLTPTLGTLEEAKDRTNIPVMAMLRPRGGGFDYSETDFSSLLRDGRELLSHGADGLVFGFLLSDGTVDENRVKRLVELAGERDTVFSRAIDVTPDWKRALDVLIRNGVKRVLTSGQRRDAFSGKNVIREMIAFAGKSIRILPGCGIREENVLELISATGAREIHLSGKHIEVSDFSACSNPEVCFGLNGTGEDRYDVIDPEYFVRVRARAEGTEATECSD